MYNVSATVIVVFSTVYLNYFKALRIRNKIQLDVVLPNLTFG